MERAWELSRSSREDMVLESNCSMAATIWEVEGTSASLGGLLLETGVDLGEADGVFGLAGLDPGFEASEGLLELVKGGGIHSGAFAAGEGESCGRDSRQEDRDARAVINYA